MSFNCSASRSSLVSWGMFRAALLKSYSLEGNVRADTVQGRELRADRLELLLPLESAAGFDEGVDRKVEADYGKYRFNRGTLVIGKMVFMVLAHQGRGTQDGKKHEHEAGGLEPEGVKSAAYGRDKRFSAGKDRIEQAVFLYNALQSIFYRGNLCHFGYCSAKIAAFERKE